MALFKRATLIEKLAREAGWLVVDTEGDYTRVRSDDGSARRYVSIRCRGDLPFVTFLMRFPVHFPLSAVTPELTLGLLLKNRNLFFGRWCLEVQGSCEAHLYFQYTALKDGLTAALFDTICRDMVRHLEDLHSELRDQLARLNLSSAEVVRPIARPTARHLPPATGRGIKWLGG